MNFTIFPPVLMAAEVALTALAEGGEVAVRKQQQPASSTARVNGFLNLSVEFLLICWRYPKWLNEFSATVQSKLNILNMEVMAIEKRIELLETNLSDATE